MTRRTSILKGPSGAYADDLEEQRKAAVDRLSRPWNTPGMVVWRAGRLREAASQMFDIMSTAVEWNISERFRIQPKLMRLLLKTIAKLEQDLLQELIDSIELSRFIVPRRDYDRRRIDAILKGTRWLTGAEIEGLLDPHCVSAHAKVKRWHAGGRIFGIDYRGATIYPEYLFGSDWLPLPVVKKVLGVFRDRSAISIASWFESTNSELRGLRPREAIAYDGLAVLTAARHHFPGAGRVQSAKS